MLNSVVHTNIVTSRSDSLPAFAFYTITVYHFSQQEEITSQQDAAHSACRLLVLKKKKKVVAYNLVKYTNVLQTK